MKRLLILANSPVGLYNFRKELLETLLDQEHEVYISLPYGPKVDLLEKLGCIFIETPVDRRGTNPIKDIGLICKYIRIVKKTKPDIVLAYTIKPNIYGSIVCRMLKTPYINNLTGLGSGFLGNKFLARLLKVMYKTALKSSKTVFFQNKTDLNYLLNLGIVSGSYKLIPGSGVNLERFQYAPYPEDDGRLVFNFVGRVMKDKGIDEYLTAARAIKQKYPNTRFNIIGSIEPNEAHYKDLIAASEQEGYVKYWGYQSDIKPFVINSHCTIHPSYREGMSNVLLESAAMGRSLIASDVPGCREVIDNTINGFTFRAADADDLIHKLEEFIRLPYEYKAEMGENSRRKVEREFNRQIVIDSYMEQINKI